MHNFDKVIDVAVNNLGDTRTANRKPVKINKHGNNAAIKVHILDEATMKRNSVYKDITFNMTIYDIRKMLMKSWTRSYIKELYPDGK